MQLNRKWEFPFGTKTFLNVAVQQESPQENKILFNPPKKNKVFLDHIFKSLLKLLGTYFNLKFLRGVHVYDP